MCDAANLNHARNAGDTGTEEHHQQDVPVDGHACITCDLFLCADELDFKAPTRFIDNKPQSQRNRKADDQAGVDARAEKGCQLARRRDPSRAREGKACRVLPRPLNEPCHKECRHIVQHQAGDELVDLPFYLQNGRNEAVNARADKRRKERQQHGYKPVAPVKMQDDIGRRSRTDVQLALAARVPDLHFKRKGNTDGDDHQRDHLDDRLAQAVGRAKRALEHDRVDLDGRFSGNQQEDCRKQEACNNGGKRNGKLRPKRDTQPLFQCQISLFTHSAHRPFLRRWTWPGRWSPD